MYRVTQIQDRLYQIVHEIDSVTTKGAEVSEEVGVKDALIRAFGRAGRASMFNGGKPCDVVLTESGRRFVVTVKEVR